MGTFELLNFNPKRYLCRQRRLQKCRKTETGNGADPFNVVIEYKRPEYL